MLQEGSQHLHSRIERLRMRAFEHPARIVLTDGADERVLAAACMLVERSVIRPLLVGRSAAILPQLKRLGIARGVDVFDPEQNGQQAHLVELLRSRFQARGRAIPDDSSLLAMVREPLYCGMLLVQAGIADGLLGGAAVPTADVIRAGIKVVGIDPCYPVVSGAFAMLLPEPLPAGQDVLMLSDVAVVPNPGAEQLASIAINTAHLARSFLDDEPVIALLSFSTYGSAKDPAVKKVRDALQLVRERAPGLRVDGEMQADAALIPEISARKAPGNSVRGCANVLIFPNLDASNIAYKLLERVSRATALGVILSGLDKPVNDLSRGCTADDIVNMVAVTALQAIQKREGRRTRDMAEKVEIAMLQQAASL